MKTYFKELIQSIKEFVLGTHYIAEDMADYYDVDSKGLHFQCAVCGLLMSVGALVVIIKGFKWIFKIFKWILKK